GLWEAAGRGGKCKWSLADINAVEQWLEKERSYTSRQIQERLEMFTCPCAYQMYCRFSLFSIVGTF
ncbi:MAG: helix-turn-helix domain-containing protein, partial [Desmonostoc geniculatum HA4340-LM1]|nr:helix-turn-helix domain-containing protein [Desmonostoc geniculatum HA4340-LM1]